MKNSFLGGVYKDRKAKLESAYSFMLKYSKITVWSLFWTKSEKVDDSDFGHFLGDGTKLKIPSEIKPTVFTWDIILWVLKRFG